MDIRLALLLTATFAYTLTHCFNFWSTKFGKGLGCLGMCLVFLGLAIALLCILLFAPFQIQNVAIGVSLGVIVLSTIVMSIFKS